MSHSVQEVKYNGIADLRTISKAEWEAINVTGQDAVEWRGIGASVPGAKFVDGAIDYFRTDPEFDLVMEKSGA